MIRGSTVYVQSAYVYTSAAWLCSFKSWSPSLSYINQQRLSLFVRGGRAALTYSVYQHTYIYTSSINTMYHDTYILNNKYCHGSHTRTSSASPVYLQCVPPLCFRCNEVACSSHTETQYKCIICWLAPHPFNKTIQITIRTYIRESRAHKRTHITRTHPWSALQFKKRVVISCSLALARCAGRPPAATKAA